MVLTFQDTFSHLRRRLGGHRQPLEDTDRNGSIIAKVLFDGKSFYLIDYDILVKTTEWSVINAAFWLVELLLGYML